MNTIMDVTLGIPYADLATVSESITAAFPFLAPVSHRMQQQYHKKKNSGDHDGGSSVQSTSISKPYLYHPRIYSVVTCTEFTRGVGDAIGSATTANRRMSSPDVGTPGSLCPDSPSLSGVKLKLAGEDNIVLPGAAQTGEVTAAKQEEEEDANKGCIMCVVVVTYHDILICDVEKRSVRHCLSLRKNDVLGTLFAHGDHITIGIAVGGEATGGDVLLQFPVGKDMKGFLDAARAVFSHHHCGLTLASRKYATQEELRNALNIQQQQEMMHQSQQQQFQQIDDEEWHNGQQGGGGGKEVFIPSQTWTITNLGIADVSDRLAHVKTLLGSVERGTKESSIEMEEQIEHALARVASVKLVVVNQLEDLQRSLDEQADRRKVLEVQEREINRLRERATGAREERTSREIDAVEELTQWREVQHHRQTEELAQRKRLAATQRRTQSQINTIEEQTKTIKRETIKVQEELKVFESDEYKQCTRKRDEEGDKMKMAIEELKMLTSEEEAAKAVRISNRATELVNENAALRKLIERLSVEVLGEERDIHMNLEREGDDLATESESLDLGVAKGIVQTERLMTELAAAEAQEEELDRQIQRMSVEVAGLKAERAVAVHEAASSRDVSRHYFYAQRNVTAEARRRRATVENAATSQRSTLLSARMDAQQRLFAERLRVQSL